MSKQKEYETASLAKMSTSRDLILGMLMYSSDNQGHFSGNIEDALRYHPSWNSNQAQFTELQQGSQDFEFLVTGKIEGLSTNVAPNTIVLREKIPTRSPDGRWSRVYGFADGHTQVQHQDSPDFTDFEEKRLPPARP